MEGAIVAICDEDILGKNLVFEDAEIHVSPEFYFDRKIDAVEALSLMREAVCINLLGNNIVELGLKHGFVHEDSIMYLETKNGEKIAYAIVHLFSF